MLLKKLMIALRVIALVATMAMILGCSTDENSAGSVMIEIPEQIFDPDPSMGMYFDTIFIDESEFLASPPMAAKIGAKMIVAWPFSSFQLMSDWTGWDLEKTPGASGSYCDGTRLSTHSGAEYYARDLNQKNGLDYGIMIFAGFAGKVVHAGWSNGYGYNVVIYDPVRHVALRYAHMSYIYYSGVRVGSYIPQYRFLGRTGNSGYVDGTHLHIVGYENINDNYGNPIIPTLCDSDYYACQINFYWWIY